MGQVASPAASVPNTPARTVESLRQEAAEWLGGAELHSEEAQAQNNYGDLDKAIEQTRFAETKLAAARAKMLEARKLEAMGTGR